MLARYLPRHLDGGLPASLRQPIAFLLCGFLARSRTVLGAASLAASLAASGSWALAGRRVMLLMVRTLLAGPFDSMATGSGFAAPSSWSVLGRAPRWSLAYFV